MPFKSDITWITHAYSNTSECVKKRRAFSKYFQTNLVLSIIFSVVHQI